jgi:TPR repeat protein
MLSLPLRSNGKTILSLAFACLVLFTGEAASADIPQLEAGAQRGSTRKQIELATDYFLGRGVQRNEQLAAYWYEKAASLGDPVAQQEIGYFYEAGIGVVRDPRRAAHWYQLASAGGLPAAKVNLGVSYLWGLGVPKNEALALQLFHEAFEKGCARAAGFLGDAYLLGVGVPKDMPTAKHWFTVGAKMHDPDSEFRLAGLLASGDAGQQDLQKAMALLRHSSDTGFVPAKHALGLLIANHPQLGAPDEAISMLEESAQAGTWKSSAVLGALARDGRGMAADRKAAYLHFKIAEMQGGAEAARTVAPDLLRLGGELSVQEIDALNSQAATWSAQHSARLVFVYRGEAGILALAAPDRQSERSVADAQP